MTLISIIIPYYHGKSFYPALLFSLKQSLLPCQHLSFNYEIITVIDSMETAYEDIVQTTIPVFENLANVTNIVYKNSKNIGVAGSRNFAISIAKGEFFHIIDQDDLVSPNFYSQIIPLFDCYNFILINGVVRYKSKNYNTHKLYYFAPSLKIKGLLKDDFIRSPGQVVFSKVLCKNTTFPETKKHKGADDRFFWISLLAENEVTIKTTYLANPEYIANIHERNYSTDAVNLKKSALEAWDLYCNKLALKKYKSLILKDKLRLKYCLKEKMTFIEKILGFWFNVKYFLTINKIVRFLVKRKW